MTLNSKHAHSLVEHAKKNNKFVFCVMQNRFSPTIMWLKKIIDQRRLGRVFSVHVNCFWNRNKNYYESSDWHGKLDLDGGPLFTQFSHFIDILYWLFGDIDNASSQFFSFNKKKYVEFEDSGIVKLNFSNKAIGVLNYSTAVWNKNFESSITIIGELGTIKIGGQYMDKIIYCNIENYILPNITESVRCNDYGDYKGSASNHDKMIDHVVKTVLGDNKNQQEWTFSDGVGVVNIIERIYSLRN